jgi:hypothetical protein
MSIKKSKALVACLSDPSCNPRPFRTIWLLNRMGYDVWTLSPNPKQNIQLLGGCLKFSENRSGFIRHIFLSLISKIWKLIGRYELLHSYSETLHLIMLGAREHVKNLKKEDFKIIVIEDLPFLNPILDTVSDETRVFYDAREYATREFESENCFLKFHAPRIYKSLQKGMHRVDGIYTVCDSLAAEYMKDFGIRPSVIRSTPFYASVNVNRIVETPIRMVYHGGANTDRGLSKMIDVVKALNGKYILDMYLVGHDRIINDLISVANDCPYIRFRKAVDFKDINSMLINYDVGFYLLQPTGFNTLYALPNKFFEYIQARLALVIGPSPEMEKLVIQYSCGIVSRDFSVESMVNILHSITIEDIIRMKESSGKAAQDLCWENESKYLIEIFND